MEVIHLRPAAWSLVARPVLDYQTHTSGVPRWLGNLALPMLGYFRPKRNKKLPFIGSNGGYLLTAAWSLVARPVLDYQTHTSGVPRWIGNLALPMLRFLHPKRKKLPFIGSNGGYSLTAGRMEPGCETGP